MSRLGDVAEVRGRVGWKGYTIEDLADDGPLVLGANDITSDNRLSLADVKHLTREKYEESPEIFVELNDVLVVKVGSTIGKVCIIDDEIGEASINPNCVIVRAKNINPYYLYYFLCTPTGRAFLINNSVASGQPALNQTNLKKLEIPEIGQIEQEKIIGVLNAIKKCIVINEKIIETSEKLIREIYDYWFVQFDFPDKNGRPYKSSGGEMVYDEKLKREIPKGWKPSNISDVVSLNARGITQKEPTKDSEKIAVVNQKCIRDGNIDSRELYWHNSEVKFKECLRLEFMDTLVNSMGVGTLGRISPFILNMEAVPHSCVSLLRYKDGVSTKCWLYSQVKNLEPYITSIGVGSTGQQSLTNKDLGEIKIAVPPIHLMTTFDEVANPIMRNIMNLNEENAKLISLRDWLLPMLMNGQIKIAGGS